MNLLGIIVLIDCCFLLMLWVIVGFLRKSQETEENINKDFSPCCAPMYHDWEV